MSLDSFVTYVLDLYIMLRIPSPLCLADAPFRRAFPARETKSGLLPALR